MSAEDDVGVLQERLLASVLDGAVLPGMSVPVRLPDVGTVLDLPEVPLHPERYRGSPHPATARAVRVLAPGERPARFLQFAAPVLGEDAISLPLSVTDASGLPLGTVIVPFAREAGGAWHVAEPPTALST